MYLDYYNIAENPFDMDKGKTSLWLGSLPKVASALKEALMERKGIVVLAGDTGTGKSTAIKMVTDILQDQFIIDTLSNLELTGLDFLKHFQIALNSTKDLKQERIFGLSEDFFAQFSRYQQKFITDT